MMSETPSGFSKDYAKKNQLIMSDKIAGTFMVPDDDIWNYFFMGAIFNAAELYDLKLDIPLTFYDELHRPIHFSNFTHIEAGNEEEANQEDVFS